jgi:deoxyhypusine synthase
MSRYQRVDLEKIKTLPIKERPSKVSTSFFAKPLQGNSTFGEFLNSLPEILKVSDLRKLVEKIVLARKKKKPILIMMGAHVIKTGLNPVLIDLMQNGLVQGLAMNGAAAIHDTELAYYGKTSEDVAAGLKTGEFGMARETGQFLNQTLTEDLGFGEALGKRLQEERPPYAESSLLGQAYQLNIPVTVHVAIGTDVVHQHASADGARIGAASLLDFHIFCHLVSQIHNGGVVLLFGSAVILPEVFLKALTVARNVHGQVRHFTTANFDMVQHYRPQMNVIERPCHDSDRGYSFTGHHEIMIPLLAAAIKNAITVPDR